MVNLLLREKEEVFECQRALLAYFSRVFEMALYGHFVEAGQDYMRLPDDDGACIQAFIKWINTGKVDVAISPKDPVFTEKLWVLADKIDAPKFLNSVVDILCKKYNQESGVSIEAVKYIYEETAPGSKLRRFLVEAVTAKGPLHKTRQHRRVEWKALVHDGGNFVLDVVEAGGFINYKGVTYEDGMFGSTLSSSIEEYIQEPLIYNPKSWRPDIDRSTKKRKSTSLEISHTSDTRHSL
jgi:hypothetical protein